MICCRVKPAAPENKVVIVQRQKTAQLPVQSHLEPRDSEPLTPVRLYFEIVEQVDTRVEVQDGGRSVLVQSLPGGRFEEVESLGGDTLIELVYQMANRGELKDMGEVLLFYECRCHEEMIREMILKLPEASQAEVWQGTERIEVECPRCGRDYLIQKNKK